MMKDENKETACVAVGVSDTQFMLTRAEEHIHKLTCELKKKNAR